MLAAISRAILGCQGAGPIRHQRADSAVMAIANAGYQIEETRRPYYSQFPYLGQINLMNNGGISNYNALQAALTSRNSHGLTFTLGYTLAHTLAEDDNETGITYSNNTNPRLDYGPSAFDTRNRLTFSATYLVPGIKSPGQILEGWQVTSAVIAQGGLPFNAVDSSDDFSGTGELKDRWTLSGPASDFKGSG